VRGESGERGERKGSNWGREIVWEKKREEGRHKWREDRGKMSRERSDIKYRGGPHH
jgi:hypothetical protein